MVVRLALVHLLRMANQMGTGVSAGQNFATRVTGRSAVLGAAQHLRCPWAAQDDSCSRIRSELTSRLGQAAVIQSISNQGAREFTGSRLNPRLTLVKGAGAWHVRTG